MTTDPIDNLDAEIAASLMQSVDEGFDAQIQLTQQLVSIPTQRGEEQEAQSLMSEQMTSRNLDVDTWEIDIDEIRTHPGFSPVTVSYDQATNVVGTHHPSKATGRSLILNGHIDVVPTGPLDMWTTPPYEPKIENGWLYGRGSGDMKAGLAANLYALEALHRVGLQPAANVYMQSVIEEECTGNGALACLARGYSADAVLISEPMNETLVRANVGVLWFKVALRGRPAHVMESQLGSNAIEAMVPIIQALKTLENDWNQRKTQHPLFADTEKPITINVGKIQGGDWASSVPCWCRIDVRAGIYPGAKVDHAKREIEAVISDVSKQDAFLSQHPPTITYNGFATEGYTLKPESAAEQYLQAAHQQVFRDALHAEVSLAYLDARVFVLYDDTPALVYGPICERIHGFDERVNLESIRRITKTIALFMAAWCGVEAVR